MSEIVRYLVDKKNKISPASQTVATAQIAPTHNLPGSSCPLQCTQECSRFHPNLITFGGVIAERVNTAKLPHNVNPIFGGILPGIEPNNYGYMHSVKFLREPEVDQV